MGVNSNKNIAAISIAVLLVGGFTGLLGSLWFANTVPNHKMIVTLMLVIPELYCVIMYFRAVGKRSYTYRALCVVGAAGSIILATYAVLQYESIHWFVLIFRSIESISFIFLFYVNYCVSKEN
jgi:hypothetical protein